LGSQFTEFSTFAVQLGVDVLTESVFAGDKLPKEVKRDLVKIEFGIAF
jgi:hypothetical protein